MTEPKTMSKHTPELLALEKIRNLSREWEANRLGGVSLQTQRWQRLGAIANAAVESALKKAGIRE